MVHEHDRSPRKQLRDVFGVKYAWYYPNCLKVRFDFGLIFVLNSSYISVPSHTSWASTSGLLDACKTLTNATRFGQVRTFRHWLIPHFRNCLAKFFPFSSHANSSLKAFPCRKKIDYGILFKTFLVVVELMTYTKCFHSLLDVSASHTASMVIDKFVSYSLYCVCWSNPAMSTL